VVSKASGGKGSNGKGDKKKAAHIVARDAKIESPMSTIKTKQQASKMIKNLYGINC
jgi:hypothetical protein